MREAPPAPELAAQDPCLVTFTSGTSGEPKAVLHGQRYLPGQRAAGRALARRRATATWSWCTAASGWSKSARNAFIAPWLRGAAALLHDARFDPAERLGHRRARGRERALHGADGVPRDRQARAAAADRLACAGSSPPARRSTPRCSAPGTRRPACGSATATARPRPASSPGTRPASAPRPGSMGRPLPGVGSSVVDGELVLDPATDPTFFLRYLGEAPHGGPVAHGRPGAHATRTASCTSRAAPTT